MITILDKRTLIEAYRHRLRSLRTAATSDREIYNLALENYTKEFSDYNLSVVKALSKADTSKYQKSYADTRYQCNVIANGIDSSSERISNIFDSYKVSLNTYFDLQKNLEKNLYKTLKIKNTFTTYVERFNNFSQESLANIDTLKHSGLIDYYFNRKSLCSVDYGLISLPKLTEREVYIKEVTVESKFSTIGTSKDPARNVKTNDTSHQYVCFLEKQQTYGAKLTYCIKLNKRTDFNEIEIIDASINKSIIQELFYFNDENEKVDIDFTLIKRSRKSILIINDPTNFTLNKVYISFVQNKHLDIERKKGSLLSQIVNANDSSFEIIEDLGVKYIYEFNIDRIKINRIDYQNIGLFRLNQKISLKNLSRIFIRYNGIFLERLNSVEVFLEGTSYINDIPQREVKKVEDLNSVDVVKYEEGSLLFILNAADSKYTAYIESIDVRAG